MYQKGHVLNVWLFFSYDLLFIHDGMNASAPVIQVITGYTQVVDGVAQGMPILESSGNGLFVHFTSDSTQRTRGFMVQYDVYGKTL